MFYISWGCCCSKFHVNYPFFYLTGIINFSYETIITYHYYSFLLFFDLNIANFELFLYSKEKEVLYFKGGFEMKEYSCCKAAIESCLER